MYFLSREKVPYRPTPGTRPVAGFAPSTQALTALVAQKRNLTSAGGNRKSGDSPRTPRRGSMRSGERLHSGRLWFEFFCQGCFLTLSNKYHYVFYLTVSEQPFPTYCIHTIGLAFHYASPVFCLSVYPVESDKGQCSSRQYQANRYLALSLGRIATQRHIHFIEFRMKAGTNPFFIRVRHLDVHRFRRKLVSC